ncbi:MAG: DUF1080 domain-containing protein [Planctomycetaceae bacterium]
MRRLSIAILAVASAAVFATPGNAQADKKDEKGWISLFNGKDFTGWKMSDKKQAKWRVENGMIVANGPRSHLFTEKEFKNFEFKAEVKTTPGSNSGIYFHTKYQETGWPRVGHESQVNVTHRDPVKTGSIYNTVKLFKTPAKDNQWWEHHIIVRGKRVIVKINGQKVIDYTEPPGKKGTVKLGKGSFALQAHDPKSVVYYRNIRVKPLAD